jgi:hypothetical protein
VVNGKKFNNAMSAMGLSNQEVADVMNYIMNLWSNKSKKIVTTAEVAWLSKCFMVRYRSGKVTHDFSEIIATDYTDLGI